MDTLAALYAQLGLTPPGMPGATLTPPTQDPQYFPYDTSQMPGTMPAGLPTGLPVASDVGAAPGGAMHVPRAAPTAPTDAGTGFGYGPQPRPDLPRPLVKGPGSDIFGQYRDVYAPPAPDDDPLARILNTAGPMDTAPVSRALSPQWAMQQRQSQPGVGQAQLDRHAGNIQPTESEKTLLRQSPAYARAINRIRALDRLRAGRGM
jgi:hypothetical protein